jgi:hypothetical protein
VCEIVPRQVQQTYQVCNYKPVERTYQTRRIVCEVKPEVVTRKERYCEMVPYQTKIQVPVWCP